MKALLIVLGLLSALLIVAQLVMGLLIRNGQASLRTAHFHSGSLMVLVALAYIALSLSAILSRPRAERSMKLYGAMRMVLTELNNQGGIATDQALAEKTRMNIANMRDWLLILHGSDYIIIERDDETITATITPKGRLALSMMVLPQP